MSRADKESYLKQYFWQSAGEITVQQALLGADALSHAAVKALVDVNKILIEVPQGWLAMELRFDSDSAENTSDVIELYAASTSDSNPDHYRHFAQLTTLAGTQEYGTKKFIDTITPVSEWLTSKGAVSPANNTFGSYALNTHGYSHILVIASTLNSTTFSVGYKKI